jgi:hypothetical protein
VYLAPGHNMFDHSLGRICGMFVGLLWFWWALAWTLTLLGLLLIDEQQQS